MTCNSSMIETSDGGLVVLMGNKLMKYDKDLNMIKEAEIKIDWSSWKKSMTEHRKMMMDEKTKDDN